MTSFIGCGGEANPPTVPVRGKVTYNGKAVEKATVVFVPKSSSGEPATAISGADGEYSVTTFVNNDGAMPGEYLIKVFKYDIEDEGAGGTDSNITLEEEEKSYNPNLAMKVSSKNQLPAKYERETTSGLMFSVTSKSSVFDIALQ